MPRNLSVVVIDIDSMLYFKESKLMSILGLPVGIPPSIPKEVYLENPEDALHIQRHDE